MYTFFLNSFISFVWMELIDGIDKDDVMKMLVLEFVRTIRIYTHIYDQICIERTQQRQIERKKTCCIYAFILCEVALRHIHTI